MLVQEDGKADPHKIAALPKKKVVRFFCGVPMQSVNQPIEIAQQLQRGLLRDTIRQACTEDLSAESLIGHLHRRSKGVCRRHAARG